MFLRMVDEYSPRVVKTWNILIIGKVYTNKEYRNTKKVHDTNNASETLYNTEKEQENEDKTTYDFITMKINKHVKYSKDIQSHAVKTMSKVSNRVGSNFASIIFVRLTVKLFP